MVGLPREPMSGGTRGIAVIVLYSGEPQHPLHPCPSAT